MPTITISTEFQKSLQIYADIKNCLRLGYVDEALEIALSYEEMTGIKHILWESVVAALVGRDENQTQE